MLDTRRLFQIFAQWLLTTRKVTGYRLAVAAAMLVALASTGCMANLKAASSGKIGCSPSSIEIEDDKEDWGSRTWTATCKGQRYFCSATATGRSSADISCTPEG
ncbi:MAG: hypothetical protein HYV09_40640 [Deltaproteobacteria bacterium]|nr:hypothetical protein [Deltaproteobacteria bacterium]